jgi:hypothetical protein
MPVKAEASRPPLRKSLERSQVLLGFLFFYLDFCRQRPGPQKALLVVEMGGD